MEPEPITAENLPVAERSIVLVGLMGVGKTTVGRRLAALLHLPFLDADHEIEEAAGCSVTEIFARFGEPAFRDGERRVIARLLEGPRHVLATGGGAFMDARTREAIKARGISIWLKADIDLLMDRVARKGNRPLLQNPDPRGTMERLVAERYPVYAEADLTVESREGPHDRVVRSIVQALKASGAIPEDHAA
ncbi:MAG: shikimate kinase [Micropepsaceae bacterium]